MGLENGEESEMIREKRKDEVQDGGERKENGKKDGPF